MYIVLNIRPRPGSDIEGPKLKIYTKYQHWKARPQVCARSRSQFTEPRAARALLTAAFVMAISGWAASSASCSPHDLPRPQSTQEAGCACFFAVPMSKRSSMYKLAAPSVNRRRREMEEKEGNRERGRESGTGRE